LPAAFTSAAITTGEMPGAEMTPLRWAMMTVAGTSVANQKIEANTNMPSLIRTVLSVSRVWGRNRAKKVRTLHISDDTDAAAATPPPEPRRSWIWSVAIGSIFFVACLLSYAL